MKIFFYLLVFFFLISCHTVKRHNETFDDLLSVDDIKSDIDYTYKKLTKLHPHLYDYISKDNFKYKFDSLKSTIQQPITKNELYFKLSPIVASIKQGHTILRPTHLKIEKKEREIYKKHGISPLKHFSFEMFENKLYVVKNNSTDSTLKVGSEILSVNNITPQEIKNKYNKTYTSDGYNQTFFNKIFEIQFQYYLYKELGILDSIQLKYLYNDSIYSKKLYRKTIEKKVKPTVPSKKKIKSFFEPLNKSNILTFDETDSCIAILKVKDFNYNQYDRVFKKIDSVQSDHLILDLRNNHGGKLSYCAKLFSYLIDSTYNFVDREELASRSSFLAQINLSGKPIRKLITYVSFSPIIVIRNTVLLLKIKKENNSFYITPPSKATVDPVEKHNFKGKIYVIIDGGTFSASSVISSNLKHKKLAYFVGEETGGAQNECVAGFIPTFILPHSKLELNFGLMNIQSHGRSEIKGRGILPDKEITPTIEDRINGIDPELQWILNDIKNTKE